MKRLVLLFLLACLTACTASLIPTYAEIEGVKIEVEVAAGCCSDQSLKAFGCEQVAANGSSNVVAGLVYLSPFWDKEAKKAFLDGFEYPEATGAKIVCPSRATIHLPLDWGIFKAIRWLEQRFPQYQWSVDERGLFKGGLRFSFAQ